MVVAWWALPHANPLPDREHREGVRVLAPPLTLLLPVAAATVRVLVVLTGAAGARAVWHGTGSSTASGAASALGVNRATQVALDAVAV